MTRIAQTSIALATMSGLAGLASAQGVTLYFRVDVVDHPADEVFGVEIGVKSCSTVPFQ